MLVQNDRGATLLQCYEVAEEHIGNKRFEPLVASVTIAEHKYCVLLVYDNWKKHWELPGGAIEPNESPHECAMRELYEETNQRAKNLSFRGIIKLQSPPENRISYAALYCADLTEMAPFQKNEEIARIKLWNKKEKINIDGIVDYLVKQYS